jgi:hypothetical protein
MTLLALMTRHDGIRLAEVGVLLGLLGGLALPLGGLELFSRRMGQTVGGALIAVGFLLLLVATHWGRFH